MKDRKRKEESLPSLWLREAEAGWDEVLWAHAHQPNQPNRPGSPDHPDHPINPDDPNDANGPHNLSLDEDPGVINLGFDQRHGDHPSNAHHSHGGQRIAVKFSKLRKDALQVNKALSNPT